MGEPQSGTSNCRLQAANPLRVTRRAVPGEHKPVSLKLFNVTDRELLVQVKFDALTNGIVVVPHRSVGVPTSLGKVAWDALPELDESGTLTIPSLASRELWLDVDLPAPSPGSSGQTAAAGAQRRGRVGGNGQRSHDTADGNGGRKLPCTSPTLLSSRREFSGCREVHPRRSGASPAGPVRRRCAVLQTTPNLPIAAICPTRKAPSPSARGTSPRGRSGRATTPRST